MIELCIVSPNYVQKARDAEGRDVGLRLSVHGELGQDGAGRGSELEAVAAEAEGMERPGWRRLGETTGLPSAV